MAYHLVTCGMLLHYAVVVNCKKSGTTDIKDGAAKHMGIRGEYWINVGAVSDFT